VDTETGEVRERVELLKIPIDILQPEHLDDFVYGLLDKEKEQNIVLLSLWDLLFARRNSEYRAYIENAALVLPISKSIVKGLQFLSGKKAVRYMPFDFVLKLLAILEKREYSAYLLGGQKKILMKTEKNIRQTFPKLHVVGRFSSYFKAHEEAALIEAIKKAAPSLILVGKGVRGKERWIARNSDKLGGGLRLWCSDIFEVFAESKKHPSRAVFDKGLEWIGYCFEKPHKFFRIFPYIYYQMLLAVNKLSNKKAEEKPAEPPPPQESENQENAG